MNQTLFVGGHVSAAGGISQSLPRVKAIGGNALQFFSASPRVWKRNEIEKSEIEKFIALKKELGVERTVIHAIYLLNLASENPELAAKSREVIEFDLRVDAATHGCGVVVHLGSHLGRGFDAVKDQLVDQIKKVLSNTPDDSTFLIENSAGQNGKIASDLSEIRWLIDRVNSPRLGWCLDTCHAHAAGYVLENPKSQVPNHKQNTLFGETESKNIFDEVEGLHLWDALKVVHVNDSRDPFDSGRDRHENIGDGSIGSEVMKSFLSHEQIRKLPLILEVPGIDHKCGPDAENVERLKKLLQ